MCDKKLVNKIVEIASDYKNTNFNDEHVIKWISQFPSDRHNVILKEMSNILRKTYYSEKN